MTKRNEVEEMIEKSYAYGCDETIDMLITILRQFKKDLRDALKVEREKNDIKH